MSDDPFLCLDYISDHESEPEVFGDVHSPEINNVDAPGLGLDHAAGPSPVGDAMDVDGTTATSSSVAPKTGARRRKAPRKTTQKLGKRRRRRIGCLYCGAKQYKLTRHMLRKHAKEAEVQEASSYPLKSRERRSLFRQLTKKCLFHHNTKVLLDGKGEIMPVKRPARNSNIKKYIFESCDQCLGFYSRTTLLRHKMTFHGMSHPERQMLREDPAGMGIQELLASMKADDISTACKTDMLILRFGSKMFYRLRGQPHRRVQLVKRIRELGKILLEFRKREEVASLQTCIDPIRFERLVEVVRQLAGSDGGGRHPRSFVRYVGYSLNACARILKTLATIAEDASLGKQADGFLHLYRREWYALQAASGALKKSARGSTSADRSRLTATAGSNRGGTRARRCQTTVEGDPRGSGVVPETRAQRSREQTQGYPERSDAVTDQSSRSHERTEEHSERSDVLTERLSESLEQTGAPEGSDALTEEPSQSPERGTKRPPEGIDASTEQRLQQNTVDKRAEKHPESTAAVRQANSDPAQSENTTDDDEPPTPASERGTRRTPRRTPRHNYKPWTAEESEAVTKRLGWFVRKHVVPGKDDCQAALKQESVLKKRTWRNVKYCVYNMIQRSKRSGGRAQPDSE